MVRLLLYLILVAALAAGFSWLADRPGALTLVWQGYEVSTTLFRAVVLLASFVALVILVWSLLTQVWRGPAVLGRFMAKRRQKRGLDAVSSGMIAVGAGDKAMATHYAMLARKSLPNEPLTHLLRAQAAQLAGDRATARRIFEAMLASPDTEQLGLRGLFVEAEREGEREAARQFAERAVRLNPKLAWSVEALFDLQCRQGDWAGALETLALARRAGVVSRISGDRRKAVLLTARAQALEDGDPDRALTASLEAHKLAPDLVPAGVIAARLLAARGNTPRAARVVEQTWRRSPHPDLAVVYAHARVGDSPRDRLERVNRLAALAATSVEGPIAVAREAIEARAFEDARRALEPLIPHRLTRRVCLLMARLEGEQHGDTGRVREWLARAVNAPRDPAWTADGVVAEDWSPISPVTGALDAFQWRVPVEVVDRDDATAMAERIEELVTLGVGRADPIPATVAPDAPRPPVVVEPRAVAPEPVALVPHEETRPDPAEPPKTVLAPSESAARRRGRAVETNGADAPIALPSRMEPPGGMGPAAEGAPAREPGASAEPRALGETHAEGARADDRRAWAGGGEHHTRHGGDYAAGGLAPQAFVPPRAPDDPGPEPADFDDDRFRSGLIRST